MYGSKSIDSLLIVMSIIFFTRCADSTERVQGENHECLMKHSFTFTFSYLSKFEFQLEKSLSNNA